MDVDEMEAEAVHQLFERVIGALTDTPLPKLWVQSVLAKVLVQTALGEVNRDEFLEKMGAVYDFESVLRPHSSEVH
jgi:hypothetical protein